MHIVDEIHEVLGLAVARRRREIACHLIAPRAVEGIFADAHYLDMRIAHPLYVIAQLVREAPVVEELVLVPPLVPVLFPRAEVHFIHGHGLFKKVFSLFLLAPLPVAPLVL